jgi:phosphoribosylformylglycinamidine cyclo-ligase
MCVNDVVCAGAEPFYFLDYFATGRLDEGVAAAVIGGIAEGCRQAGCALAGGETAEMPGVYAAGVYDLAGFCVGGVERAALLGPDRVTEGMVAIALASSGLHSNGFSLVRKVILEERGLSLDAPFPHDPDGRTTADVLLTPTRIYVRTLMALLQECTVAGACHITGGGFTENLPRVLPDGLAIELDSGSWSLPNVFARLQEWGGLTDAELRRTFNCGVGMVVIVASEDEDRAIATAETHGDRAWRIGRVIPRPRGSGGVEVVG